MAGLATVLACCLTGPYHCAGPAGLSPSIAQRSLLVLLERMAPYLAQHLSAAASAPQSSDIGGGHYAAPGEAPTQRAAASEPAPCCRSDPGASSGTF